MDSIESLKSAWIFDKKGQLKQTKRQQDKARAKQIYCIAKQALRYAPVVLHEGQKLRRISFINGNSQWLVTISHKQEITVMHKQE